jgi:uncharacterized protein
MDRGKRNAAIGALAILFTILIIGAILVTVSAPKEDLSWVPTLNDYVNDRAGVLDAGDAYDLEVFCADVESNNTCQIAVLIVNTTGSVGVNDYALKVFEKNGIGQKGKDNGVLFVMSFDEGSWRVVTGAGVSDILNGGKLTEFQLTYLDPNLESGNYSTGIKLFVYAMGLELVNKYQPGGSTGEWYPIDFIPLNWWQLGLAISVFLVLMVVTKGRAFLWIGSIFLGGRGGFGGGRTGGGGARGRF